MEVKQATNMKFYLNNKEINVLNGATFSIKKDETLDSGKIELIFSDNKAPIKPMSEIKIVDDTETYYFVVLSDTVEIASKEPKTYKHTLDFAQSTKRLSKIQVRNTQFSQPAKNSLNCGCNATFLNKTDEGSTYMNNLIRFADKKEYSYSMEISEKHKVKNAYFKVNTYWSKCESETAAIYEETMQDTCPTLTISFDVYKGDTLLFTKVSNFNNGDVVYYDNGLESGVYTIKNIKVVKSNSYSENDLFIINVLLVCDVYYYSLYDVLDILRKQIALQESATVYQSEYPYYLPLKGELYTILKTTVAPNLTFTQCNLFECLEQIFMYLDGYPTLENGFLSIRYFNDNNGEIIESKESDAKIAMSEQRYVNGFITDFQNASLNNVLTYPSKKAYSNVQNKTIGIADNSDNYIMRVDYPIYNLRSVKLYVETIVLDSTQIGVNDTYRIKYNRSIDIAQNIFNQDLYINLDVIDNSSEFVDDIPPVRQNCLIFNQKSTEIDVGTTYKTFLNITHYIIPNVLISCIRKMFGTYREPGTESKITFTTVPNMSKVYEELKYQIEYETLSNGRLLIEGTENKFNGAERLDIGQGASDIMKTGLNLLGMSVKTGVDTLVRTEKFTSSQNRIKVGSLYYENGERYIATKVDECVFGDFIFSTIQYTKNFNKLSQFISLDQKKRFNEVDSSLTLRSEDVYKEYLYFSFDEPTSSIVSDIHLYATFMQSCIEDTFKLNPTNEHCIDYCSCNTYNLDGSSNSKFGNVWLPLLQYGSGNALCYEMAFNSPINANSNFQYDETLKAWYSKYILYTSDDAFADKINIDFYHQLSEISTDNLPQVDDNLIASSVKYGAFSNLAYYKKPNETFALNYELLCLPYQNQEIYIGEQFIKYNGLIANAINKKELRLFISDSQKYSILDKYGLGDTLKGAFTIDVSYIISSVGRMALKLQIYKDGAIYHLNKKIVSWAICDEDNNILISANKSLGISDNLIFYIFTSHSRL